MVEGMDKVKIYGERNTGTNFVTRLIRRNFLCELYPGTLAEARPGYRESFEHELERMIPDECKRIIARQIRLDEFFNGNLWSTLGWKHCVPPTEIIHSHPDKENVLFIAVTKNPYAWVQSLYRRPYENVSLTRPADMYKFINEPWITGRRENTPAILDSPVELWNLKTEGYERLTNIATVVRIRYEDVLADPVQFLEKIGDHLERRKKKFELPIEAIKKDDIGKKDYDYYRDYYLNERWREELSNEHIRAINHFLTPVTVKRAGYKLLHAE